MIKGNDELHCDTVCLSRIKEEGINLLFLLQKYNRDN